MGVLMYGTGRHAKEMISKYYFLLENVIAFIDSFPKENTKFYGKNVISPEEISSYKFEKVVITSEMYFIQIRKTLHNIGIVDAMIEYIDDYVDFAWQSFGRRKEYLIPFLEERKKIIDLMKKGPMIKQECLEGAKILENRDKALPLMPKDGVVAEIGVAYGDFSEKILETMTPKKMYAIDLFHEERKREGDIWGRTWIRDSGLNHREWYEKKFSKKIDEGILEVKSGLSYEVLKTFPDNFFDYVYIDACHEYESVKRDAEMVYDKVKNGGIVAFNDYTYFTITHEPFDPYSYYGVALVANEFINKTNSKVLFLCLERHLNMDIVVQVRKS